MDMDIQDSIIKAFCLTGIAFLLYKTDAIMHYAKLFGAHKLTSWRSFQCLYIRRHESVFNISPLEFVKIQWGNDSFFASLIGCPYCLFFWVSIFICGFNLVNALFCYCVYIFLYKAINKF